MQAVIANVPSPEALRHRIDAELRSAWDLYVALRGDRVVGMLALKPGVGILDQIFVAPEEQGKGVGRALLELAKQLMPAGFHLRIDASNDQARRFYEAEGMKRLREGFHPWSGIPVHFYGWNVG